MFGRGLIKGLSITMRHFIESYVYDRKPWEPRYSQEWLEKHQAIDGKGFFTIQYPEQKRPVAERFRGRHRLRRRADGSPRCVACYCCQTACPTGAITIVAEEAENPDIEKRPRSFEINLLRCIFCGMCVEACPKDAIYMTRDYELAERTREQLRYGLEQLLDVEKGEG